jgi:hypothetical protein
VDVAYATMRIMTVVRVWRRMEGRLSEIDR